ncbi:MAG TPA: hypothetical protein VI612_01215 [Candidatus Nanoarchaeia archaeon]|nr:hypothetical protein [Candidatus Nanoarchaeia archaeon]
MPEPIVLEFIAANGAKHYFIGSSEETIIADVKEHFKYLNSEQPNSVPLEVAQGLVFYRQGYEAVKKHGCSSFKLGGLAELVESR